jgi:hypothetical protein
LHAVSNVLGGANVPEIARVVAHGMRNCVDIFDGAVGHEKAMFEIQIYAVPSGTFEDLTNPVPVLGVNSV